MSHWREWAARFLPEAATTPAAERVRSGLAAAAGVLFVVWCSLHLLATPLAVVAALGASSVLVFALPASPLAQPWSVVGSYLVSAAAGVAAAKLVPAMTRGLHQVPIVDAGGRLLGLITQSDMIAALYHGRLAEDG